MALAAVIPHARLVAWDRGGHIGLGHHPEIDDAIRALLRSTAVPAAT